MFTPIPTPRKPSGGRPPPSVRPGMPVSSHIVRKASGQGTFQAQEGTKHGLIPQPTLMTNVQPFILQQRTSPDYLASNNRNHPSNHIHSTQTSHVQGQKMVQRTNINQPTQRMSMPPPRQPRTGKAGDFRTSQLTQVGTKLTPILPSESTGSEDSLKESTKHNILPNDKHPGQTGSMIRNNEGYKKVEKKHEKDDMEAHFDQLLDTLQIPQTVRQKFSTVSPDVKSSLISSSLSGNAIILSSLGLPIPTQPKIKKRMSTPLLRRPKSSSSLNGPSQVGETYQVDGDQFVIVASPLSSPDPNNVLSPNLPKVHALPSLPNERVPKHNAFHHSGAIYREDGSSQGHGGEGRPPNSRQSTGPGSKFITSNSAGSISKSGNTSSIGKAGGNMASVGKKNQGMNMERPDAFISWLQSHKGTDLNMDVGRCKKLRMLLRHETTMWVGQFVNMGGYDLVLARLQDLLDIEWSREEQHDDQMLYEILRCIKAFSTSEIGKTALRSSFPKPFPALSGLMFSEKKPGELATRQIMVELWLFLFELFPLLPPHQLNPSVATIPNPNSRPISLRFETPHKIPGSEVEVDIVEVVRGLLIPEEKDKKDIHEFISQAHRPRVFKAWIQEMSDICRDYFWVMCHGSNTLWALDQVDESLAEKPVAPGGATGGVEFEAMGYVTTHFKLLNALCIAQAAQNKEKATQLHYDLLVSGLDRILVTFRKASTVYYPTLHLELARYVTLLRSASPSGRLPHLIDKLVGPPPETIRKRGEGWLPSVGEKGWDPQV
ncbi:hypothetical protein M231_03763 [Tremella mesenterica]|uniref:Formin GTPase-binding domain-containing protein n=1 Tax=Tremella mesenterica TaxID=5217 RepID=A0A4Q1BM76_TREME|nr:hypothetical protein M231_03763 [Tremella mesenterica]